jgi:hypothetical protein
MRLFDAILALGSPYATFLLRCSPIPNPSVLVENEEAGPTGSDSGGLLADLLESARRRNLSANSLTAY